MKSMKNLSMAFMAVFFTIGAIAQTEGSKQSAGTTTAPAGQENKKADTSTGTIAKPASDNAAGKDTTVTPK